MADDMVTIEVWASTSKAGSACTTTFTVERKEWESMSADDKDEAAPVAPQTTYRPRWV